MFGAEKQYWFVNYDIPEETAEEHGRWYVDTHIPQILAVEGFIGARRLRLAPTQNGSKVPVLMRGYLTVFEICGDPENAFVSLHEAREAGLIDPSPYPVTGTNAANFLPLGPAQVG